jgi:adenylylsulfate kinase
MRPHMATERALTIWITGLSGAGKTTLSNALAARFREHEKPVQILDGDVVRKIISSELGFSKADRDMQVRRLGYIAGLLTQHGVTVIVAAISPYRSGRDAVRSDLQTFVEVYCECPLDVLEQRDPKGLYKRARRGELAAFTGVSDPYEPPLNPEVVVHTGQESVDESTEKVWRTLTNGGHLR